MDLFILFLHIVNLNIIILLSARECNDDLDCNDGQSCFVSKHSNRTFCTGKKSVNEKD